MPRSNELLASWRSWNDSRFFTRKSNIASTASNNESNVHKTLKTNIPTRARITTTFVFFDYPVFLRCSFEGLFEGWFSELKRFLCGRGRTDWKNSLLVFVWNRIRIFIIIHVLLVISRTYCNEDVSRLLIEHACCSLFQALAALRPSRPVHVNRVAGRRLFGISRTRCIFAFRVILFYVFEKWSKRHK